MVVAEGNPRSRASLRSISRRCRARREAATRIRLAATQNIVVVAKTSKGEFFTGQKLVKVTIGGCGG